MPTNPGRTEEHLSPPAANGVPDEVARSADNAYVPANNKRRTLRCAPRVLSEGRASYLGLPALIQSWIAVTSPATSAPPGGIRPPWIAESALEAFVETFA